MVDMHSHFLPAIDDGAKNITEAAEMLRYAKDNGTDIIVATPHIRPYCEEDISEGIKKRNEAFSLLCNGGTDGFPEIRLGFEVYLGAEITQHQNFADMCILDTNLMLLEMPFKVWDDFAVERVTLVRDAGIMPILAHIERYIGFRGNKEKALSLDGVIYQVTAEAFLHFGTRRFIEKLIKSGKKVVVGSDMHDPTVRKSKMREAFEKEKNKGEAFIKAFNAEGVL